MREQTLRSNWFAKTVPVILAFSIVGAALAFAIS